MLEVWPYLLLALVVVVLGGMAWWQYKRQQDLRALAGDQGWNWIGSADRVFAGWQVQPFDTGHTRRARNAVVGQFRGHPIVAFDYSYCTTVDIDERSRRTTKHRYGVVAVRLPQPLPDVRCRRRGLVPVGQPGAQFEWREFNSSFRVVGEERLTHALVHQRMMEHLMAVPACDWQIEGDWLIGWARGNQNPADIMARLTLLTGIADLVPGFVWRDYGGQLPPGRR